MSGWLQIALVSALAVVGMASLMTAWRVWSGPEVLDRVLALDTLYVNLVALLLLWHLLWPQALLFEVALLIVAFGFIGTVAAARYLARQRVIE